MVGEFLRALDDFLIRLEKYHGTSSDWVGVCVAGELSKATRLHHHYFLLFILLFYFSSLLYIYYIVVVEGLPSVNREGPIISC